MASRRIARHYALMVLYGMDFSHDGPKIGLNSLWNSIDVPENLAVDQQPLSKRTPQPTEKQFADLLVRGVSEHLDDIDHKINTSSRNWTLSRMATAERNILRIGVYEMFYMEDIPVKVSINEAIEMAKVYCEINSYSSKKSAPQFINDVLDNIAKLHR